MGRLTFVLATQVDNYIYAGDAGEFENFERFPQNELHVEELLRREFAVFGCHVSQHDDISACKPSSTK